jgi:hypothetical protein
VGQWLWKIPLRFITMGRKLRVFNEKQHFRKMWITFLGMRSLCPKVKQFSVAATKNADTNPIGKYVCRKNKAKTCGLTWNFLLSV